jgi:hypothetical protein
MSRDLHYFKMERRQENGALLWTFQGAPMPEEMKTLRPLSHWMEKAAQLWCLPKHEKKEMDADLAFSIAELALDAYNEGRREPATLEAAFWEREAKKAEAVASAQRKIIFDEIGWHPDEYESAVKAIIAAQDKPK